MIKNGHGSLLTRLSLSLALTAAAGYFFLGRAVVLLFYEGKAPLADRFVRHAHLFPLDYYQQKADAAFLRFALFAALLLAAVVFNAAGMYRVLREYADATAASAGALIYLSANYLLSVVDSFESSRASP